MNLELKTQGEQAQRCGGVAAGQTKAAAGGCRAEQTCEPRSIAAAALGGRGPQKTRKDKALRALKRSPSALWKM